MSLPYESNATDWTKIRCIKAWIEYPFADDGDTNSKIYKMLCMCKNASYSAPAFSDVMSSATVAKLVSLPFTADSNAYFVGDSDFQPSDGGTIQFVRSFAPVPSTRSRAIGNYTTDIFPEFREWTVTQGNVNQVNVDNFDYYSEASGTSYERDNANEGATEDMPPAIVLRERFTKTTYAQITFTYVYATSQSNVTPDEPWQPIHYDTGPTPLNYFRVGAFSSYLGQPTGENINNPLLSDNSVPPYVYDTSDGIATNYNTNHWTTDKSIPSKTEYENDYIDQVYLNVESKILPWMGNIYVKETISVLAK